MASATCCDGDLSVFSSPTRKRLSLLPNSPAVHAEWDKAAVMDSDAAKAEDPAKKRRRISDALHSDMKDVGAFFLDFEKPDAFADPFMGSGKDDVARDSYRILDLGGEEWTVEYDMLRKIFSQGVLISKVGCMYPHPRYCTPGEGDKRKAYQRALAAFTGLVTTGNQQSFNDYGWPNWAESSHTCHHHKCMNPTHVQAQAAWRHRRRTYCGVDGVCDCGQTPPCLGRYGNDSPMGPDDICSGAREAEEAVSDTLERFRMRFKTSVETAQVDETAKKRAAKAKAPKQDETAKKRAAKAKAPKQTTKAENAAKRKKAGEKQAYQAARKAAKRVAKSLASKQVRSHALPADCNEEIEKAAESAYLRHLKVAL